MREIIGHLIKSWCVSVTAKPYEMNMEKRERERERERGRQIKWEKGQRGTEGTLSQSASWTTADADGSRSRWSVDHLSHVTHSNQTQPPDLGLPEDSLMSV